MKEHPIPAHIMALDDPGDLNAEKGSVKWARAMRYQLQRLGANSKTTLRDFQTYLQVLEETHGYQQLDNEFGHPFPSLKTFAETALPYGLGYDPDVILHIQEETRDLLLHDVLQRDFLMMHGGDRRSKEFQVYNHKLEKALKGTATRYVLNRLKRHRPDLAEAYTRGEYRSVHAAAKAAGWVKDATPLDLLRRAWNNATDEEKLRFVNEVVTDERDRQNLAKELSAIETRITSYDALKEITHAD